MTLGTTQINYLHSVDDGRAALVLACNRRFDFYFIEVLLISLQLPR